MRDAGAVTIVPAGTDTEDGASIYQGGPYPEGTGALPGSSEAGDGFGASLVATAEGGVAVGVPGEDHQTARNTGNIHIIRREEGGDALRSQGTKTIDLHIWGAKDSPQQGDRFAATLSSIGSSLVDQNDLTGSSAETRDLFGTALP